MNWKKIRWLINGVVVHEPSNVREVSQIQQAQQQAHEQGGPSSMKYFDYEIPLTTSIKALIHTINKEKKQKSKKIDYLTYKLIETRIPLSYGLLVMMMRTHSSPFLLYLFCFLVSFRDSHIFSFCNCFSFNE